LKTLYISQRVPFPPNKGEKIRTFHQIEYLLKKGHEISLCCPYTSESELVLFDQLKEQYSIDTKQVKLGPSILRYLSGIILGKPLSVSNFYNIKLQQTIDKLITEETFQNIICTSSSMAEYIFKSSALPTIEKKPKLIMDFMDLDSDKWSQYSESSISLMKWVYQRESKLLAKYERKINNSFDHCFFISQAEVDLFCINADCTKKPLAIGNGMDNKTFTPAYQPIDNSDPVFIFTGVMDYKPNIDSALWFANNVWPKIISKYPLSRFIVAGMNPVQSIQDLSLTKGIEVTGFVDDILPYYHQSDFFVAPLQIARGVQNKVLQAFSCGLPVISTSMGAEGIDYIEGENILIADTPDTFFERIEQLINDKVLYQTLKSNAITLIKEHYTWEAKLSSLDKLLT